MSELELKADIITESAPVLIDRGLVDLIHGACHGVGAVLATLTAKTLSPYGQSHQ